MGKKLNISRIMSQIGCSTKEEVADQLGWTIEDLKCYIEGTAALNMDCLMQLCSETGLNPKDLFLSDKNPYSQTKIDPDDTFEASEIIRDDLVEYIKHGLEVIDEESFQKELTNISKFVKTNLIKPKITFAGQSDTGKSTLINALLGTENMPAKWTPTTSIAVHIKHIEDKPDYIKESVWIFGKNSAVSNDSEIDLSNEEYCKNSVIAKGDLSILNEYGTHQGKTMDKLPVQ